MANLKGTQFIESYESRDYQGPAMRIGSGVLGGAAYLEAFKLGYRIVGGDCPTVGIAGGFAQGGGHSPLSSVHGYGADNILEWEVVTPQGKYLIATPEENNDLYWALSGGGGGTFGITLSMTVRLHKETPTAGAALTVSAASAGIEALWDAIDAFHERLLDYLDTGSAVTYQITNETLSFYAATAVGKKVSDVEAEFAPYLEYLARANISYDFTPTLFPTYYEHLDHYFGPFPYGHFP
jgi:FAD/FMN-containing dehydrogenase